MCLKMPSAKWRPFFVTASMLQWNFNRYSSIFIHENVFETSSAKWWTFCLSLNVIRKIFGVISCTATAPVPLPVPVSSSVLVHGPVIRRVKFWVAHAPGMPGTFSSLPTSKETVTHVPWCISGSLTRGGGENVPGIPGACASHNSTYLVRGPSCELVSQPASQPTFCLKLSFAAYPIRRIKFLKFD